MKKIITILFTFIVLKTFAQTVPEPGFFQVGNINYEMVLGYDYNNFWEYPVGSGFVGGSASEEGTIVSTGQGDSWDGAFEVAIDDSAFINVTDFYNLPTTTWLFNEDTSFVDPIIISTDNQVIKGLTVSKQYYFSLDFPIIRFSVKIENPTASDMDISVKIGTNVGSDGYTQLDSCSTETLETVSLTSDDRWSITSDGEATPEFYLSSDPVNTIVRF